MNQKIETYSFSPCSSSTSLQMYQSNSPVSSYYTWPVQHQNQHQHQHQYQYTSAVIQGDYSNYQQHQSHYYANSTVSYSDYSFSNNSQLSIPSDYNSNNSSDSSYWLYPNFHPKETTKNPIQASTPVQLMHSRLANKLVNRHNQLPDKAIDIMNEYFNDHLNNPYPTQSEKENLAQLGGISVKQVTAWFSNRRNRSQNTKPKRMKRVLEQEINNIFDELIGDQVNKQAIIDKVRSTIVGQELNLF